MTQNILKEGMDGRTIRFRPSCPNYIQTASVPDIVIEHVCPSEPRWSQPYSSNPFSKHEMPALMPLLKCGKKLRAHSDSTIYETQNALDCKSAEASDAVDSWNVTAEEPLISSKTLNLSQSPRNLGPDDFGTSCHGPHGGKFNSINGENCFRTTVPFLWHFGSSNKLTVGLKNSPKDYWLRRHSDSNVSEENSEGLQVEPHPVRSRSTGDTVVPDLHVVSIKTELPEKMNEEVKHQLPGGSSLAERFSEHSEDTPSTPKWSKLKTYLQSRYENHLNQTVDADDVFTDRASTENSQNWMEPQLPDLLELPLRDKGMDVEYLSLNSDQTFKTIPDVFIPITASISPEISPVCGKNFDYSASEIRKKSQGYDFFTKTPLSFGTRVSTGPSIFTFSNPSHYLTFKSSFDNLFHDFVTPSSGSLLSSPFLQSPLNSDRFQYDDLPHSNFMGYENHILSESGKSRLLSNPEDHIAQDLSMESVRKTNDCSIKENYNLCRQTIPEYVDGSSIVQPRQETHSRRPTLVLEEFFSPKPSPKKKKVPTATLR